MLIKEFDGKYEMVSIAEEQSRWMFIDIFVLDGIVMAIVFSLLMWAQTFLVATIGTIVIGILIGSLYWYERQKRYNKILEENRFLDLGVFCSDGILNYQYMFDKYEILRDGEWICINDAFILDTTAMFKGGYNIHESILSFVDDTTVLTKYGVGKAPCVAIMTTYEGEYELEEKTVPVLMIRLTGPVAMELSK